MRSIEVRRHTMRVKPGQHLSQDGVNLARRIGNTMEHFERVITSPVPRAYETAIAMGFAVHEQSQVLGVMPVGVEDEIVWDAGFAAFAAVIRASPLTGRFADMQRVYWHSIARSLPENARALLITHGGFIEAGAVACLPDADHAAWGAYCDYCEGVRLAFDGGRFVEAEILRVDKEP